MAKNRSAEEIKLIESGWGVLAGFNHLLITLAATSGLPPGTLYRLGTPEGQETLLAATKAFLAEVAKTVVPVWRTVTSGPTREQLVAGARAKGRTISGWASQLIAKVSITTGATYHLVVIRGEEFATDAERTFANIQDMSTSRGSLNPPAEIALFLVQFSQKELGYRYLVVMHDPILDSDDVPVVLGVSRHVGGNEWVRAWGAYPADQFGRESAFVFLAPQGMTA